MFFCVTEEYPKERLAMLSLENADKVTRSANSLDQADQAVIVCCHTIAFFFILTFT